eukprot:COSAG03_NODE_21912_length_297_cov_1.787879_1_plen_55_part_10
MNQIVPVEFWTQLRSADGQRMLKRADGSEDLALRGFWEGLSACLPVCLSVSLSVC